MSDAASKTPTLICGGRRRAQPDALERAGRLGAAVLAAGVGRGDKCVIMARNDIEFLEVSVGIASTGANPLPINTRWTGPEVAHVLTDAKVRMIFAHTEFVPVVEAARELAASDARIVEMAMPVELLAEGGWDRKLAEPTGRHELLEELIAAQPDPVGHIEGAIADSMGVIYTSGTTGKPKGVAREKMTPQQLLTIAGANAQRAGLAPGVPMLVAGPLYHTSPNALAVLGLRMGAEIVIMPKWDARKFLRLVDTHRIRQVKIVPTMISRILSVPAEERATYDLSSLTHVIHSAAPCPPALKRAAIELFGDALWEFYGCSEAGTITWISASEWLTHPGSVGRPADGSAVTIADEDGNPLPAGELGCVYVRGADYWPRFEYLNLGAPSSAVPGMLWVGDLGYLDADGYLYLTGRDSEVVIRGGVNIYPAEIENTIIALEDVEDVAVFGVPDSGDLGEAVAAHIQPRPGAHLAESVIREALSSQLADYKVPTHIRIVDSLPRDDSGKVYKRQLRTEYTARHSVTSGAEMA
ncbi:AMP-binding protein [Nocardia sp. CDC153]|uniref:AMP-binding protein n=1 Tax=Nocardia sp. CDC153 TaxID=3112167 RepID=UPI002DBDB981|nr:AMP-binding protein [Nocardia sp. CDC153]MEC3952627.1 AMP-binding protein [Nocardia sp. CDC153]